MKETFGRLREFFGRKGGGEKKSPEAEVESRQRSQFFSLFDEETKTRGGKSLSKESKSVLENNRHLMESISTLLDPRATPDQIHDIVHKINYNEVFLGIEVGYTARLPNGMELKLTTFTPSRGNSTVKAECK